jgi:tetraacyldisaccharide 4'-kinase
MRLIEKVWFKQHPAKWLLVPILLPFSLLFWLISLIRRCGYRFGIIKSYTLSKPVIVVGNIGVGGNGKTPVVVYLVEKAKSLGLTPGVISRGYGGDAPTQPYLLNSDSTPAEAGDEPVLIYQRCKVPVAVGSNRIDSANRLIQQGCDVIISDDGLQHYRLKRDVEVIVVDGNRLFGNGLLLPAGPLREGTWRLTDAQLLIANGGDTKALKNELPCFKDMLAMQLIATNVCNVKSGEILSLADFIVSEEIFKNQDSNTDTIKNINAIAGIGDPQRFFDTLLALGFNLVGKKGFIDHKSYHKQDFEHYSDDLPLLMTEKDAVKCTVFAKNNWWYLPVDASFTQEDENAFVSMLSTLKSID